MGPIQSAALYNSTIRWLEISCLYVQSISVAIWPEDLLLGHYTHGAGLSVSSGWHLESN